MIHATRLALTCLAGIWLLAGPSPAPAEEPMRVDLVQDLPWQDHHFVMTNWFYRYRGNEPAAQVRILAERGYDGVMLSLKAEPNRWAMLPAYLEALEEHGLRLTAIPYSGAQESHRHEDWDGGFVQHACPVEIDGAWHLDYAGNQTGVYRTAVAIRE